MALRLRISRATRRVTSSLDSAAMSLVDLLPLGLVLADAVVKIVAISWLVYVVISRRVEKRLQIIESRLDALEKREVASASRFPRPDGCENRS